jgi:hypothetical protein
MNNKITRNILLLVLIISGNSIIANSQQLARNITQQERIYYFSLVWSEMKYNTILLIWIK